jgi:hypothetical protein
MAFPKIGKGFEKEWESTPRERLPRIKPDSHSAWKSLLPLSGISLHFARDGLRDGEPFDVLSVLSRMKEAAVSAVEWVSGFFRRRGVSPPHYFINPNSLYAL